MQRRVRENQIEWTIGDERLDVAALETEHLIAERIRLQQHRFGVVDADRFVGGEPRVKIACELAGAAAEVDDAHARSHVDEGDEVVERLAAFNFESFVLIGIPRRHSRITPRRSISAISRTICAESFPYGSCTPNMISS